MLAHMLAFSPFVLGICLFSSVMVDVCVVSYNVLQVCDCFINSVILKKKDMHTDFADYYYRTSVDYYL